MKVVFNKSHTNLGGNRFEFRYEGEVIDEENVSNNVDSLLTDFVDNNYHNDMLRNVAILRTILKDYEEKMLIASYISSKESIIVRYDGSELTLFERNVKSERNSYDIKYTSNGISSNIDFNSDDKGSNITDSLYRENLLELTNSFIDYIFKLNNISKIGLDNDSSKLIEIYKIFYDEDPDFRNRNIGIKTQAMMAILSEFGIDLGDGYNFNLLGRVKMPISLKLSQLIDNLYCFGKIVEPDTFLELDEKSEETIKIVGNVVREYIGKSENEKEALVHLSKAIYVSRNYFKPDSDVEEIAHFCGQSVDQIESSMVLIKKIDSNM